MKTNKLNESRSPRKGDRVKMDYYNKLNNGEKGTCVGRIGELCTIEWDDGTKSKEITSYLTVIEEAEKNEDMIIGYDEGSIKEQIRILNKNIEDYKQLIIDEPEDKDYWEEQIKKCEEEIADLQSYKPLDEAADIGEEDFIEVNDPSIVDKLDFAGAVEIRGNKVYGDANTLKQLKNEMDNLTEAKVFGAKANKLNEASYSGDSKYYKVCGSVKEYNEDGFAFCPECEKDTLDEALAIGDKVQISTPGNAAYDGRQGVVDYVGDVITVLFSDGVSPKMNNFDPQQVKKLNELLSNKNTELVEASYGGAFNDYDDDDYDDDDDEGKMVGVSFDISAPSNMKESEIETIIRKAIGATDLDIPGYMEIHTLEESLNEDNKLLPIQELNPDGTPKQYDVKFMDLEKVPGLLNWDIADQLQKYFRDNKLWVDELYFNETKGSIEYDINCGDWKHEHLRSKWLIEELFKQLGIVAEVNSYTTEEDGTDNYSAHYVVRATGKMNESIDPPSGEDPDLSAIPQIGQEVMYRGKITTIVDYEQDPEYGYDFLVVNPFWNGQDERFKNIWVGNNIDFVDYGPNDIGLQPPG